MFSNIPILIIDISNELPPYDKNGSVTPVTGIRPITTIRFISVWNIIWKSIPNDKYFEKVSFVWVDIFIPLIKIIENKPTTITAPITPNSSAIIENIKSVCGSGK